MRRGQVSDLNMSEPVAFDLEPLRLLVAEVGVFAAELVTDAAIEEVVSLLGAVGSAWKAGEFSRLKAGAAQLAHVAGEIGMQTVAQVSSETSRLADGHDPVALSANVARLQRVGGASLHSLTDIALEGH